ncbi:MAG: pyruvate kinase, partial [Gammaproteobacteria bacterium]|nr:pyruvate kinase [Gammaproteobacteria bacterium]
MAKYVDIERVGNQLDSIYKRALEFETRYADDLALINPALEHGARNLVHYLALRQTDIRKLQEDLAALGLSSLGRAERNVMASINAVRTTLTGTIRSDRSTATHNKETLSLRNDIAEQHKKTILGDCLEERDTRIMVTLPTEAASDDALIPEMLAAGMNIAR